MKKILINFAHPAIETSKMNAAMIDKAKSLENVTVNNLYSKYPDFIIDVEEEQKLLESHDIIVLQYPMFWFSTPSLLKEWIDLVLEYSWAYGSKGKALEGKSLLQTITISSDIESYGAGQENQFTLMELCIPMRATASVCKMKWIPPFVVYGINGNLESEVIESKAEDYMNALIALRDEKINIDKIIENEKFDFSYIME